MAKLSDPKKWEFLMSMSNDDLVRNGIRLRNEYIRALNEVSKMKAQKKEEMLKRKRAESRTDKSEFIFRVAERKHRMQDIARVFTVSLSYGHLPYELVKNTVFLKFIAFKRLTLTTKVMMHGGIMTQKTKYQFRKAVSKMKDEGYLDVTHKDGTMCNYYLTQKGKEESELLLNKFTKIKLI